MSDTNKRFQIVTITTEGKISSERTKSDHPSAAVLLIALRLQARHANTAFVSLYDLVERESIAFGQQTAFCDENATFVVTRLY
jgi:hypothetical protein